MKGGGGGELLSCARSPRMWANMHPFYTATLLCCALPLMQEKLVAEKKKTADLESKLAAATVRDRTLPHTALPQA